VYDSLSHGAYLSGILARIPVVLNFRNKDPDGAANQPILFEKQNFFNQALSTGTVRGGPH
jgi:hypothetical protein